MRELYAAAESFLEAARIPSSKPYVEFPYPSELDQLIDLLVSLYPMATDAERSEARQILTHQNASDCLQAFVLRMATQGCRRSDSAFIAAGLMALVLEDKRSDYRETLMLLSVVINAAVRIGADLVQMFDRATEVATPKIAETLRVVLQEYLKDGNSSLM
ncbi:MAG TPA: hypothetical protein VG815_17890, partial [Chloroflexota bacterium]|nr:hypothetical protein [Chloroflexota bacterium]